MWVFRRGERSGGDDGLGGGETGSFREPREGGRVPGRALVTSCTWGPAGFGEDGTDSCLDLLCLKDFEDTWVVDRDFAVCVCVCVYDWVGCRVRSLS